VLQFNKRREPPFGGFKYFAQDLRQEWRAASEDPGLLNRLMIQCRSEAARGMHGS
jgi:hypothetical protein